jgi:hypothetical protein
MGKSYNLGGICFGLNVWFVLSDMQVFGFDTVSLRSQARDIIKT